jgi:hypothetical protein
VNYRRSDTKHAARLLRNALVGALGEDRVFIDTNSIRAGEHFERVILKELELTKVFLCLIGSSWISAQDTDTHERRINQKDDFVRRELATALAERDIIVVPVVFDGAKNLPERRVLPECLQSLRDRTARFVLDDEQMDESIERLVKEVQGLIDA